MATSVTVYGPAISPAVARVLACLHEKDVAYSMAPVDMAKGEHKSPSYLKLHPFGQVPAFQDDLASVFESRAICRYICEKYADRGNQTLMDPKASPAARAAIEQWLETEGQSFNPPSIALVFQLAFAPMMGLTTDPNAVEQNQKKLEKVLDVYEQRLGESRFLAGDEFTLADLSHLPNADVLVSRTGMAGLIMDRKNVGRWWEEISARPAWKRVVELQNPPRPA